MKNSFLGVLAFLTLLFVGVGAHPAQASGSLDSSFGSDGKVITVFGTSNESANSIAIQSNGKIVVAGSSSNGTNNEFTVTRYNTDGSLDSSFDSDGKVTTTIGSNADAFSVAIQSDGKIVLAGNAIIGGRDEIAVARYNTDGSLDSSFDSDGKVTTTIGEADYATSVVVQSDGKIVVAGSSATGGDSNFALIRFNTDGSLDSSFDPAVTPIGSANDEAYSVAIQSNGKIVVAGYSDNGAQRVFAVARYNTDGSLDSSFNSDGKVTTAIGSDDLAKSVAIQSDGKIVVAGSSSNGSDNDFALIRYNTDGSLDSSFASDGKVITVFGSSGEFANSVALQSDGKIVVAGSSDNGAQRVFAVARYSADGSLDSSFDSDGKVTTAIGSGDFAFSVAIQSDGKIVVVGSSNNGSDDDFALIRYNTDGSLDSSFALDGKVITVFGSSSDFGNSVAIQSDGKIVVAGSSNNGSNNEFAVARYNTDGSLDSSFDSDGKVTTAIGLGDYAFSLALQSDGKIVVAGSSNNGSNDDFAILRYGEPAATAPGAPTIGSATALSPTSISITFTAPTSNGGATIETYTATSTPGSITGRVFQSGSGSITITGLTSSTAYTFRVTASNSVGTSSASGATASITTPPSDAKKTAAALDAEKAAALAAAKAAAKKREVEKQSARVEIVNSLLTLKVISLEMFTKADISGVTAENIAAIQSEISTLPQTSRVDLSQVVKIARKYEVVGQIASDQVASIRSSSLIEIGLIPEDSKYKATITATIQKLPPSDRSSYASIKKAIDAKMAEIQSRKDRIAKVTARINSRYSK